MCCNSSSMSRVLSFLLIQVPKLLSNIGSTHSSHRSRTPTAPQFHCDWISSMIPLISNIAVFKMVFFLLLWLRLKMPANLDEGYLLFIYPFVFWGSEPYTLDIGFTSFPDDKTTWGNSGSIITFEKILLAPMGVLAPGSMQPWPSAQPPINTILWCMFLGGGGRSPKFVW